MDGKWNPDAFSLLCLTGVDVRGVDVANVDVYNTHTHTHTHTHVIVHTHKGQPTTELLYIHTSSDAYMYMYTCVDIQYIPVQMKHWQVKSLPPYFSLHHPLQRQGV